MNTPKQYRKKPVVIEAVRYQPGLGGNCDAVARFLGIDGVPDSHDEVCDERAVWSIPTLEGDMYASPGDFIIRGVAGEFYPCKPDIFEATYEAVEEER